IIVTGGSSGMGKGMATRFVEEGHQVVITGRNEEKLATVKDELMELNKGTVHTVSMDVRNTEDIDRMVEETVETFGTIDGLVNKIGRASRRERGQEPVGGGGADAKGE